MAPRAVQDLTEPHRAFIEARLREMPHLTLHGLKDELAGRGVKVSHNAVWQFLRREGLSCAAGGRRASGCAAWLLTATGAR